MLIVMNQIDKIDKIILRKPKNTKKDSQGYPIAKLAFCIGLFIVCFELLKLLDFIPILLNNVKIISFAGFCLAGMLGLVSFSGEENPKRINLLISLAFFAIAQIPIFIFFSWISFFVVY